MSESMPKYNKWLILAVFLAICSMIEFSAAWWTQQAVHTWYPTLAKPAWTPPPWVFAPVWSALYICIAFAGWLIYLTPQTVC